MKKKNDKNEFLDIELSTVFFYKKGTMPSSIELKDIGIFPGSFTALYGNQSKTDGFMSASTYAKRNGIEFTVIDLIVRLDHKKKVKVMVSEDLISGDLDFISFRKMSRELMDKTCNSLLNCLPSEQLEKSKFNLATSKINIHLITMQHPYLIEKLIKLPEWKLMKLIEYTTMTPFSDKPLNVATIPVNYWHCIKEATCRLNPNILVTLTPPDVYVSEITPKMKQHISI